MRMSDSQTEHAGFAYSCASTMRIVTAPPSGELTRTVSRQLGHDRTRTLGDIADLLGLSALCSLR